MEDETNINRLLLPSQKTLEAHGCKTNINHSPYMRYTNHKYYLLYNIS